MLNIIKHTFTPLIGGACLLAMAACSNSASEDPIRFETPEDVVETAQTVSPNFLVIVLDDVGYSDLGAYGGEIETPNLDAIIQQGLMFTNYYVAGTCSPTRSMLMTGVDHHRTGLGNMGEHMAPNQVGQPGYEGYLTDRVVTIAERLKTVGYNTYVAGKWHLGKTKETSPAARGFDRSFILTNGGAGHFDQTGLMEKHHPALYLENGDQVDLSEAFTYSTDFYTQMMIDYIEDGRTSTQPFFAYLAYTAPHWPLQARPEDMAKYRGAYDAGWEETRQARLQRQIELGLVPESTVLAELTTDFPAWDELTSEERQYEARRMEIFAAMVDRVDQKVGELISYLKSTGQYENTVIILMSDNGSEGAPLQDKPMFANWAAQFDNSLDNIGSSTSYLFLEERWAQVGNTPYRLYKGTTADGGIRVPGAIHYAGASNQGVRYEGAISVLDISPTIMAMAGATELPERFVGKDLHPVIGKDLSVILEDPDAAIRSNQDGIGWELFNKTGYRMGKWKATKMEPPFSNSEWQLFDLESDPGETNNLAEQHPEILTAMISAWDDYAEANGVIIGNVPPER